MEKKIKNYKINYETQAIEINTPFAKKAGIVGSKEYNELKNLQKEHPTYNVVVIKRTITNKNKKSCSIKGITREFLYEYAEKHEKDNSAKEFQIHKANNDSFLAVKKTFLEFYPEFKELKTKGEWLYLAMVS